MASRKIIRGGSSHYSPVEYLRDGKFHRIGGPARSDDHFESWYSNGELHRLNGPAHTSFNSAGEIIYEQWYKKGRPHRIGGPARSRKDGSQKYFEYSKLHRLDGPAIFIAEGGSASASTTYRNDDATYLIGPNAKLNENYINLPRLWAVRGVVCLTPADFQREAKFSYEQMYMLLSSQPF